MASEYHVKVVPDASDFQRALMEQIAVRLNEVSVGVLSETVIVNEYDNEGRLTKQTTTVHGRAAS